MADQLVKIFKALSDETRVEIVRDLLDKGEHACSEVSKNFEKSQPTLSHHFNKLIDANILIENKKGVNRYYKVNIKHLNNLGINIKKLTKNG